jgi:hypothetical protein
MVAPGKGEVAVKLQQWAAGTLAEATGRESRTDPVLPRNGGPAGNARLTAWTGVLLLALFLVELATLLNLDGLISWHIVVGALLVPPALLKTATTGWRVIGYYRKRPAYHQAGPPPVLLRLLGPLVVLFTLAVLGSGLALVALGPASSRTALLTVFGQDISAVTIHQGTFVVWAVVTGLHCLARLVPAMRILTAPRADGNRVPGRPSRAAAVLTTMVAAAITGAVLLGGSAAWTNGGLQHDHHLPPHHTTAHT